MSGRFAIMALCASLTVALVGCRSDDDRSPVVTNNGDNDNGGNPPTNPNDGDGPESIDGTTDNTVQVSGTSTNVGGDIQVVFAMELDGAPFNSNDPGQNGTLPGPDQRFEGEFDYRKPDGARALVKLEVSTYDPQRLSANAPRVSIHPTDPAVRFTLRVIDGPPPGRGTPGPILVDNESIQVGPGPNNWYSFGFDNP